MILVDFSQIALAGILINPSNAMDEDIVRHFILNSLRFINSKFRADYGEMVLACDHTDGWRKKIFPYYKANRKKSQSASALDWNQIFLNLNTIRDEIQHNFPYKLIRVPHAEADDIIGTLCMDKADDKILIVSGDKDFQQLQRYPWVSQWDHTNKRMIKCEDPESFLIEHIIRGDTSDGVPNVLSNDNVFVEDGLRQSQLRAKRFEEIFVNAKRGILPEDEKIKKNYIRNKTMIDLMEVPDDIRAETRRQFTENVVAPKSGLLNYFIKKKLKKLRENLQDF